MILVAVFKELSKDILQTDAKFHLDQLPSMKNFLAHQAREDNMKKVVEEDSWSDNESSEVSPLSCPKGTFPSQHALP